MKYKSLIALSLCTMLILLSACDNRTSLESDPNAANSTVSDSAPANPAAFTLIYSGNDTLNPYTAVTKNNQEVTELLFDPLIKLDSNFNAVYVLAEEISLNNKSCIIKLKSVQFSDGSTLTAEDVTYSIKKARESTTRYKSQLENIASSSASNATTVSITLKKSDPFFINLLDFPIIKMNSDSRKNEDNIALPPIGSGRYIFDEKGKKLNANTSYIAGKVNISEITLIDAPDNEALEHAVEVGSVTMHYTDLSDNLLPKMTGKSISVPLNNLVYLGVNFNNSKLAVPEIRQAISCIISRTKLSDSSYYGRAIPAVGPLPASFSAAEGIQTISAEKNIEQAVANLAQVGYTSKDSDGFYVNNKNARLSFNLLYNLDNSARANAAQLIKDQMAEAGIEIKLRSVNWDAYQSEISNGKFDLFLGEIKMLSNMDFSALVIPGGSAAYGAKAPDSSNTSSSVPSSSSPDHSSGSVTSDISTDNDGASGSEYTPVSTSETLSLFYAGRATLSEVLAAFNAELPFIPICHRCGQVVYSPKLSPGPVSSVSDIFFGIENCSMSS